MGLSPHRYTPKGVRPVLPSIDTLLRSPQLRDVSDLSRLALRQALRAVVDDERRRQLAAEEGEIVPADELQLAHQALALAREERRSSLGRVINATGVVLHTNLGRAPMAEEVLDATLAVARRYTNLELDLETGERDSRHLRLAPAVLRLFGAEDAAIVNNNAAAVLLCLSAVAAPAPVAVARGEQVEIGGSFRLPDIIEQSGARVLDIGTTNKVRLDDYARAIDAGAGAVLKVHRSNFEIRGFTQEVDIEPLAALCRERKVPLIHDLGMGLLAGEGATDSITRSLRCGVPLLCCSGDKLLSGPQAGLILGESALLHRIRRHPLTRVLRPDKMVLAAMEATLLLWERDPRGLTLPATRLMALTVADLRPVAESLAERLRAVLPPSVEVQTVETDSTPGGGTLPEVRLPSAAVSLRWSGGTTRLAELARTAATPIVGRLQHGALLLDVRTLLSGDADTLVEVFAGLPLSAG